MNGNLTPDNNNQNTSISQQTPKQRIKTKALFYRIILIIIGVATITAGGFVIFKELKNEAKLQTSTEKITETNLNSLPKETVIATIGTLNITKGDLDYKKKIEIGYSGKESEIDIALLETIHDKIFENILSRYSLTITKEEIEKENERIHKETLVPESLKKLEDSFNNKEAFLEFFVKPVLIKRTLKQFFEDNHDKFDPKKIEIAKTLEKLKQGELSIKELNADTIKSIFVSKNPPKENIINLQTQGKLETTIFYDPKLLEAIRNLKQNEFLDYIYNAGPHLYALIKLDSVKQDGFNITAILFRKKTYDDWLNEEIAKTNIQILNTKIKKFLQQRFPQETILKF